MKSGMNDMHVKLSSGQVAVRYQIIGTRTWIYALYEPSGYCGPHSTLLTIDETCYGRVGTRRLPSGCDALPIGAARSVAVDAWHEVQYQEAYAALRATYPEAAAGHEYAGQLEVVR